MGINYQRLYDYRLSGVDQALRQAVWAEIAVYQKRPDRLACPGPRPGRGTSVSSSTRFPLLSGGRSTCAAATSTGTLVSEPCLATS